jgi:hypothetical protein
MGNKNVTLYIISVLVVISALSASVYGNDHFVWTPNTGNNATIAVLLETEISIQGVPLEFGDEIGVFTPDGLCVGGMVWCGEKNHAIAVWGDNIITNQVDGIREGERMHFRVWKKSTNQEHEIPYVIFQNGIDTYQTNGIYVLLSMHTVTAPEAPVPISPAYGAEIAGHVLDISWSPVSSAEWYHFQLAGSENFIDFIVDANYLTDTTYRVDELEGGRNYYWRVRASNSGGSSGWSGIQRFNTKDELVYPPTVPTLISPANNATGVSIAQVLLWSSVQRADSYHLQIAEDDGFTVQVMDHSGLGGTQYQTALSHGTVYYWRVRAQNDGGFSDWSGIRSFTTLASGDIIMIHLERGWNMISSYVQPMNPSMEDIFSTIDDPMLFVKNRSGMVYWPGEDINEIGDWVTTEGYQVYVSRNHILYIQGEPVVSENTPIPLSTGWNQPAFLHPFPADIEAVMYPIVNFVVLAKTHDGLIYWPIYGINDIGYLEPGKSYQIYMKGNASLIYPSSGVQPKPMAAYTFNSFDRQSSRPVIYKTPMSRTGESAVILAFAPFARDGDEIGVWDSTNNLVGAGLVKDKKAAIVVWGNDSRTDNVKDGAMDDEQLRLTWFSVDALEEKRLSLHSVQTITNGNEQSKELRYFTNGINIVETYVSQVTEELPVQYSLAQNYPNPFNPRTIIAYTIPSDEHVRITIYSASGQIISTLVDEQQPAGVHEIAFDAVNLSSGMYIYHLQAGYYSDTRKMLLIR